MSKNEDYRRRLLPLVCDASRIHVTGNLKLDVLPQSVDIDFWRRKLDLDSRLPVLTVSCTHAPEEELLLDCLEANILFLVPRHPERFEEVAQILTTKKIPFIRWSQLDRRRGGERVILVDAMGQLPICYSLSRLAIVAGSYIDRIGGHNVLEPCLYGTPVFFGPHMFGQAEFAARVTEAQAGKEVPLDQLRNAVRELLNNPIEETKMRAAAFHLMQTSRGSTKKTLSLLAS